MGSLASSPLSLACLIAPIAFSVVKGQLSQRQALALDQLKDKAAHILKPSKTPKLLAHESHTQMRQKIIKWIIMSIILAATVLTYAAPQYMTWSFFFDTEANPVSKNILRGAGLGVIGVAALLLFGYHVGYLARLSYVSRYWNIPRDVGTSSTGLSLLYAQRDHDLDLQSLRSGVFWIARDPETFANRLYFIGIVLSSCSWLLLLIFSIVTILVEPVVVKRDMVWGLLYGPVYDTYRALRGGQFWCTCLNKSEAKLENLIRKKQQELAEITTTVTTAISAPTAALTSESPQVKYQSTHDESTSHHVVQIHEEQ